MRLKVLPIGLAALLISGLMLGACLPEEITSVPISLPAPTLAPPRPDTLFVTEEKAQLFQDDFEDGNASGWALEAGWDVTLESSNHVLTGCKHSFARPDVSGWSDYTIEARFKLDKGSFHVNLRENLYAGQIRYFLGIFNSGLYLQRQITSDFFNLSQTNVQLGLNQWHTIKAVTDSNNIKAYLDGTLMINYTDSDIPILSGISSFETLDNSLVHIDDISVTGTRTAQRASWVKTGGPSGGLGYDVRINPFDKNIMFVTDNPSGVNKSYNGGDTWMQRNEGITARAGASGDGIPIFCLTIDPNNTNIVWAGTQGMRGIYKSTDGGETWTKKDNGITEWNEITFRGFSVHPQNSDIVFAGAEINTGIRGEEFPKVKGKIYKTQNGGESWRCVWEGGNLARFVLINPQDPNIMYASTGIFDREAYNGTGVGILKSTDGGETWRQINNGVTNLFVGFLEMHPRDPNILFAAAGMNVLWYKGHGGGVYRTTDGGEHWAQVLSGDVFTVVTISPSNPKVVYAGSCIAFYRSDDGGNNWQTFCKQEEHNYGPPGVTAGFPISAVVDPDDPMIIFANNYNGGVFRSTDGAKNWVNASRGYTGADCRDIAVDAENSAVVYVAARSGNFGSTDGGKEWRGISFGPASGEAYSLSLSPDNPLEMLAAKDSDGMIIKSTNGGKSWRVVFRHPKVQPGDIANRHGFKTIGYAPSNPDVVYAGMRRIINVGMIDPSPEPSFGIYKSVNGGETWTEKNSGLENSTKIINHIVVHPQNPDIAYAATFNDGVFKTTDGGKSWIAINNGLLSLDVRSLAIDPKNPDVVYAGLAEGVGIFKTINGGELWEAVNAGIQVQCPSFLQRVGQVQSGVSLEKPKRIIGGEYYSIPWTNIESIVIDPVEPQTLYAADLHLGVYMSIDGGESWTPINDGLLTKAVTKLALSTDGWVLYAATSGEGVFRLESW